MGRTSLRLFAACAAVVLAVVCGPQPAFAHGKLVSSIPAAGSTMDAPTSTVTLAFTEKVAPYAFFAVVAPSGVRVDQKWSHAEPFRLEQPVTEYQLVDGQWQPREFRAGFPARVNVTYWPERGTYAMRYQSVASDGEPVQGEVRFTYSGPTAAAPPGWRPPADEPSAELLTPGKVGTPGHSAVASTSSGESDDKGPWPWLVPILLVIAVVGGLALALTGRGGQAPRRG
jgi:methionine-rich copper-binding protein CopC